MTNNKKHWSQVAAENVIKKFPENEIYTCAAGITPSGRVHIGNFRDVITADLVHKNLLSMGEKSRLIFSWDDYDRFRKVPIGIPENFKEFLGLPLSEVPDPEGKYESYAKKYEIEFEETLERFGIKPEFIRQSEQYKSGRYVKEIRHAFKNRKDIGSILNKFKTGNMDVANYFPLSINSEFTGKDNTKILAVEENEKSIIYKCLDTNKVGCVDLENNHSIKLPWRVDWPMRWGVEGVSFEPGGKDHSSPGGSYEVGAIIAKKIFGIDAPVYLGYEFIGIRGLTGKMSGSTGFNITPKDCLDIYEPELVKWLFARARPSQSFDLAFDSEVIRQYDEFDKEIRRLDSGKLNSIQEKNLELSKVNSSDVYDRNPIPFRQVVGLGQAVNFDRGKLDDLLVETEISFNENSLDKRLIKGKNWLDKYNEDQKFVLRESVNTEYFQSLNLNEQNQLLQLKNELQSGTNSVKKLEEKLYSIPKNGLTELNEMKDAQKRFFNNVYQMLFDEERGPRLPTYLWAQDKDKIVKLLNI